MREEATDSGTQQQACQGLAVGQCASLEPEPGQSSLGLAHIGGDRAVKDDPAPGQGVGNVGLVVARKAVPARQAGACVADPVASQDLGHVDSLIKVTP